jgi:hypothetical protein
MQIMQENQSLKIQNPKLRKLGKMWKVAYLDFNLKLGLENPLKSRRLDRKSL